MRTLLFISATLFASLLWVVARYMWDSSRNRGSEFGYYGEFNRVSNALAAVPGVTITGSWTNNDVTLEEFSFALAISNRAVELFFGETDAVRNMKKEAAVAALQGRIAVELASASTNGP